jgi:5-methylcytosine-specific restriction endonuclease McrA
MKINPKTTMAEYIQKIIEWAEPQILSSVKELKNACPSYGILIRRGHADKLHVNSLADIEEINRIYRECKLLSKSGKRSEVDHIVPLFQGGTHSVENLRIMDYTEHRNKSGNERRKPCRSKTTLDLTTDAAANPCHLNSKSSSTSA